MKTQYVDDEHFGPIMAKAIDGVVIKGYYVLDGFLYKGGKLCIPSGSVWEHMLEVYLVIWGRRKHLN